jgi:hypothetical protein
VSELKPLLVPAELRDALAEEAAAEGVSVETAAARAIEHHIEAAKTRRFFEERAREADPEWLLRFLSRPGGEPPAPGDEVPPGYKPHR